MPKINILLPINRDYTGSLQLQDDFGTVLAGPFAVSGRASDTAAREHGNPSRTPTLPYGDTPLGSYRVVEVRPTGEGTGYGIAQYGPNRIVVLEPVAGEAALAEANGRFVIFIQGGALSLDQLRATNGCLRLSDDDQAQLIHSLSALTAVTCECAEISLSREARSVVVDADYDEGDAPPLPNHKTASWVTPVWAKLAVPEIVAHGEYDGGNEGEGEGEGGEEEGGEGSEPGPEPSPEPGPTPEPEAGPEPGSEPEPGAEPSPEPGPTPEPVFGPEPEPGPEPDIESGLQPLPGETFPHPGDPDMHGAIPGDEQGPFPEQPEEPKSPEPPEEPELPEEPPQPPPPEPKPPHEPPDHEPKPEPTPTIPPSPAPGSIPISAETGKAIAQRSAQVAQNYKSRGVKYVYGGDASTGGGTSDCSHFVADALRQAGINEPFTSTGGMATSPHFQEVPQNQARAGDIIVQGGHMGVYMGNDDPQGRPVGTQMGDHQVGPAPWGPGGWFKSGGDIKFYRPQQ